MCVHACVHACARACVCACVCVRLLVSVLVNVHGMRSGWADLQYVQYVILCTCMHTYTYSNLQV